MKIVYCIVISKEGMVGANAYTRDTINRDRVSPFFNFHSRNFTDCPDDKEAFYVENKEVAEITMETAVNEFRKLLGGNMGRLIPCNMVSIQENYL